MYQIYQIMPGETIETIAQKLGTTVEELRRINGNVMVMPGMNIIVPDMGNNGVIVYNVERGDNLYAIARRFNVNFDNLVRLNGLNPDDYIYPGQEILIPNDDMYITSEGDTIQGIASKLNIDLNKLLTLNEEVYVSPDQIIVYKKENTN
ncbi:MAG: LysM peptidoglycan-binding domain-containing protein [Bacilli bacterium]|nr:LysM peptidoglycan-binding domain-containing protein [Bacilli bacterium]MDD4808688.1 LysM peptidoglycan-binding domain-containing protein [Bacilli bacterium]